MFRTMVLLRAASFLRTSFPVGLYNVRRLATEVGQVSLLSFRVHQIVNICVTVEANGAI